MSLSEVADKNGGKKTSEKTMVQTVQRAIPIPKRVSDSMWQKTRKRAVPPVVMAVLTIALPSKVSVFSIFGSGT